MPQERETPDTHPVDECQTGYLRTVDQNHFNGRALAQLIRAAVERGRPFRFQAPGLSMYPFIRHGDLVEISPIREPVRIGQVVAVAMPPDGRLVVHRVVRRERTWVQTQGDNCDMPDAHVPMEDVLGVVTAVRRMGRRVRVPLGLTGSLLAWCQTHGVGIRPHRWIWWALQPLAPVGRWLMRTRLFRRWQRWRLRHVPIRNADVLDCLLLGMDPDVMHDPDQSVWVAGRPPQVLGAVTLVRGRHPVTDTPIWWLYSLRVHPLCRGGGLAERLCDCVHRQAAGEGAKAVFLWVRNDNAPALRLYERMGYKPSVEYVGAAPFEGCVCLRKELP